MKCMLCTLPLSCIQCRSSSPRTLWISLFYCAFFSLCRGVSRLRFTWHSNLFSHYEISASDCGNNREEQEALFSFSLYHPIARSPLRLETEFRATSWARWQRDDSEPRSAIQIKIFSPARGQLSIHNPSWTIRLRACGSVGVGVVSRGVWGHCHSFSINGAFQLQ